ncbi:MAG: gfo/Idh/MocA family oxidoreductase, partial [Acidobacteria bacterium]
EAPVPFDPIRAQARLDRMVKLKTEHLARAKRYTDYRDMLEHQKDIDAVMVATPDHMHASIALAAMDLGKHVYVQKPLCWSIEEARKLSRRAKETKVATQMGNQGHSSNDGR